MAIENNRILFAITVEVLQEYCEMNVVRRRLTDAEIQRVDDAFCEVDCYDLIDDAVRLALDPRWGP